ncbi:MAG TPA: hypothetical protein PKH51_01315, partial [Candidatus Sumerlaeota bacterium]|nr:hypothetical protein [Candidatus Sumerlaeota bacterium]
IHARDRRIVRSHIAYTGPLVIDARMKPWYPAEVSCAPEVAQRVAQRWKEYFPAGMTMGDSERAHLSA